MAISLASLHRGAALRSPLRMVLAGSPGIGKTTFACSAPNPVVIQTEDGLEPLIQSEVLSESIARFPVAKSFGDVMSALEALQTEDHDFKTVVLDSLDWLEPLIWETTCQKHNQTSLESFGYGRGYLEADTFWGYFLDALNSLRDKRGLHCILVAHTEIKRFESPDEVPYDRYQVALHKRAHAMMTEWADVVAVAKPKNLITTRKEGSGKLEKSISKALSTTERVLILSDKPSAVAKNRYNLPPEMPLDWAEFAKALKLD